MKEHYKKLSIINFKFESIINFESFENIIGNE